MTEVLAAAEAGTATIRNPVLAGFHPDPSILRVGADYYLATSTFEWYPGVRLHHSRDLVHWRPIGGVLTDRRLVDLTGCPDSGGVWAPQLSHVDGRFHLVFTNVRSYAGGFWDTPNFLTTAPTIEGPWSDPVFLHARGFDPSLFHDGDGHSWLLTNLCDWRPGRPWSRGIIAQEYDRTARRLIGEPRRIFPGTPAGFTEGPHLYRRDGWYYLVTAEGGTGWEHQVTVARSATLAGPYEPDPGGPLLSSADRPDLPLQKAGHGSLVETPDGEWFLAHLTARPLDPRGRCVLGRETALQRVTWRAGGWPHVAGRVPHERVAGPALPAHPWPDADPPPARLHPRWSTLRRPADPTWLAPGAGPGQLRLVGGQSPSSRHDVSLVARPIDDRVASFEAVLDADPRDFQQGAGIVAYYNSRNWHFLRIGHDGVTVLSCDRGRLRPGAVTVPRPTGPVLLRAELDGAALRFGVGPAGGPAAMWPQVHDASILSDEYATEALDGVPQVWGFTGAFFGLWAQDLSGAGLVVEVTRTAYEAGGRA